MINEIYRYNFDFILDHNSLQYVRLSRDDKNKWVFQERSPNQKIDEKIYELVFKEHPNEKTKFYAIYGVKYNERVDKVEIHSLGNLSLRNENINGLYVKYKDKYNKEINDDKLVSMVFFNFDSKPFMAYGLKK